MNWAEWNETMTLAASLLHQHGKKLGVCIQSGCGDDKPGWASGTNPPCATLFRDMPWADTLSDMVQAHSPELADCFCSERFHTCRQPPLTHGAGRRAPTR